MFNYLIDGESGGGVCELPDQGRGQTGVEREDALTLDNVGGLREDADLATASRRLEVDLQQVERVGAACGAGGRQTAEIPTPNALLRVCCGHPEVVVVYATRSAWG